MRWLDRWILAEPRHGGPNSGPVRGPSDIGKFYTTTKKWFNKLQLKDGSSDIQLYCRHLRQLGESCIVKVFMKRTFLSRICGQTQQAGFATLSL